MHQFYNKAHFQQLKFVIILQWDAPIEAAAIIFTVTVQGSIRTKYRP
jgi:hypothetical protein